MTNKEMITRFKDMADIADASYAMLHYVFENIDSVFKSKKWEEADNITNRDKTIENDKYLNGNIILPNSNTAYARAIESRFQKDIVIEKGTFVDDKLGDSPKMVSVARELSQRTKNFVNRYKLIEHQPNADYGFSATLFKDTKATSKDSEYILAIRGTEITLEDLSIDITLARNGIPMQCYELARFYEEQIKKHLDYKQKLIIVGHSLGGYLAQSFCFMYPDRVAELYTFNSPGLLGAWNKDFIDDLLSGFEIATYAVGGAGIARKIGFKLLTKSPTTLKVMAVLGLLSLTINIKYATWIPKELQKYSGIIKYLIKNIKDSESREGKYMPYPLDKNNHYHIEATNLLDFEKHMSDTTFYVNLIQHLGTDIAGNYYPIYLGNELSNSHFLAPMLNVLYFYSYLLELDSNYDKVKDKSLSECIEYCNKFMNDIKIHLETFVITTNKNNKRSFEIKNGPFTLFRDSPKEMDFLEIFLSRVAVIIGKSNQELSMQGKSYYTSSMQPTIPKESIIDFVTTLSNDGYYMSILDKEYFAEIRKKCDDINNINNVGYKACLAEYRNFIIINKNNQIIENKDNLGSIYGYNSSVYRAVHNKWCETSLGSHCKIIQGLYYGGKATMIAVKGA